MLAGLGRDGGLYVPAAWPRLDTDAIAAFAGRPYAEVAVEIIPPFLRDAIPESDLAPMTRGAYGRVCPPPGAPPGQVRGRGFLTQMFSRATPALQEFANAL